MTDGHRNPIVAQGRNCWRIARAEKASVIVDAADYYRIIAAAMEAAQKRIFVVGWDFDTRIALDPDDKGKGETLGHFFLRLGRENPQRQIDILKWNFGALKQLLHATSIMWLMRWKRTKAIDFQLRRLASRRLQPSPEDRRHRRPAGGVRRDRHCRRPLGHAGASATTIRIASARRESPIRRGTTRRC